MILKYCRRNLTCYWWDILYRNTWSFLKITGTRRYWNCSRLATKKWWSQKKCELYLWFVFLLIILCVFQAPGGEVAHPLDTNYESLRADLTHLKKTDKEFTVLESYLSATQPQWRKLEILDVWKVDREGAVSHAPHTILLYCASQIQSRSTLF